MAFVRLAINATSIARKGEPLLEPKTYADDVMNMKSLLWLAALLASPACLAGDGIQNYTVPKEHPALAADAPNPGIDTEAAPIRWTLPGGWEALAPTSIRIGNFLVPGKDGKKAEVAVTSFPGPVGTELNNVNRWRREIGLEPVAQNEVSSQTVQVDAQDGKLYDLAGAGVRTVVASVPHDGATWFFKLKGDPETVAAAKEDFQKFLKSVRFGNGKAEAPSTSELPAMPSDAQHRGLGLGAAPQRPAEPKWNAPANWTSIQPNSMILKCFNVPGQDGKSAMVAISVFPGEVGGTFANVNRWRRQLGLPPISQEELPSATQRLEGVDNAVYTDLTGFAPRSGKPARMVAVIVPRGDNTWFYKLLGDEPVVAREKAAYLKFVQAVQYP